MISRIHQKLGTAGFIISIVALVAAMGGGAYAASGGLSGKQKKEVAKIAQTEAKKVAKKGKNGQNGQNGANGAVGPVGPAGPKGADGSPGANGTNGTNGGPGAAGASVTNTALPVGNANCPQGGAEFKVGTGAATRACNGQTGFTDTLPAGKTETGAWSIDASASFASNGIGLNTFTTISFPIPLEEESPEGAAFVFNEAESTNGEFGKDETTGAACIVGEPECEDTGCSGTVAEPTASPGVLCVFTQFQNGQPGVIEARSFGGGFGAFGATGATLAGPSLIGQPDAPANLEVVGTWAVTAPTA